MSLYTEGEICGGCVHAVTHDCCKRFCHCDINAEDQRNHLNGTCLERKESPDAQ